MKREFFALSSLYHPDSNTPDLKKYYQITEAYDELTRLINPSTNSLNQYLEVKDPFQRSKVQVQEYYQPLSSKTSIFNQRSKSLSYTIRLNWLDVLREWNNIEPYSKKINYYYEQSCSCEEICFSCKGTCFTNQVCKTCNNRGVVHFCEACQGTGGIKKNDTAEITLEPGLTPPETLRIQNKGNVLGGGNIREPLFIRIFWDKNVQRRENTFIVKVPVFMEQIIHEQELKFEVTPKKGVLIKIKSLKKLPYRLDVSSFFESVYMDSKNVKCYLYFYLRL